MNQKKMYKLTGIPEELELVRNLYSQYLRLWSISKLEVWCNENGNFFDKSALKVILSNPVYAVADELLYEYFADHGADIANTKAEFDGSHGVLPYNRTQRDRWDNVPVPPVPLPVYYFQQFFCIPGNIVC